MQYIVLQTKGMWHSVNTFTKNQIRQKAGADLVAKREKLDKQTKWYHLKPRNNEDRSKDENNE